jgi:ABC-type polar amino acid transport system ATPase subunit
MTDARDANVKVQIRGLRKSFGDHHVLRGIDCDITAGEVVCVIGPSGSGKSTFLRCINCLEEPTEGTIIVEKIGPVTVAGLTVDQAQARVSAKMGQHYQGSSIKLTVGQTRTVVVNVLGEVINPGTYTLSAFSMNFHQRPISPFA